MAAMTDDKMSYRERLAAKDAYERSGECSSTIHRDHGGHLTP